MIYRIWLGVREYFLISPIAFYTLDTFHFINMLTTSFDRATVALYLKYLK